MHKLSYLVILLLMATPALALPLNSTIICSTNSTLQENITVYKDGNITNLSVSTFCPYDCDNVTMACSPPDYLSDFYGFIIVIGFFVGLALVLKYVRRF